MAREPRGDRRDRDEAPEFADRLVDLRILQKFTAGDIAVDANMRTSVPNIYAIGDCATYLKLAHVGSAMGIVAGAATDLVLGRRFSARLSCAGDIRVHKGEEWRCFSMSQLARASARQVESASVATAVTEASSSHCRFVVSISTWSRRIRPRPDVTA